MKMTLVVKDDFLTLLIGLRDWDLNYSKVFQHLLVTSVGMFSMYTVAILNIY